MFYDKFVSLCAQKGESPTQVAKNIGLSNAAATGWKNGKKPNDITLRRLSDYFSIPVEELRDVPSVFYNNYVRLCAEKNMSPSAVALDIGIRKSNVTYWKNGRNNPSDVTLAKIANFFGVTVEELMIDDPSVGIKKDPIPKDEAVGSAKQKLLDALDGLSDSQIEKLIGIIEEAKKLL